MNRLWLTFLCSLVVSVPTGFFWNAVSVHGAASEQAAAWAQAIFTVVAIFITGQLALLPVMEERARQFRARKAFLNAVADSCVLAWNQAADLNAAIKAKDVSALRSAQHVTRGEPAYTLKRMLEMSVTEWPDALFYDSVSRFYITLNIFFRVCDDAKTSRAHAWDSMAAWAATYAQHERAVDEALVHHMHRLDAERDPPWTRVRKWLEYRKTLRGLRQSYLRERAAKMRTDAQAGTV